MTPADFIATRGDFAIVETCDMHPHNIPVDEQTARDFSYCVLRRDNCQVQGFFRDFDTAYAAVVGMCERAANLEAERLARQELCNLDLYSLGNPVFNIAEELERRVADAEVIADIANYASAANTFADVLSRTSKKLLNILAEKIVELEGSGQLVEETRLVIVGDECVKLIKRSCGPGQHDMEYTAEFSGDAVPDYGDRPVPR